MGPFCDDSVFEEPATAGDTHLTSEDFDNGSSSTSSSSTRRRPVSTSLATTVPSAS